VAINCAALAAAVEFGIQPLLFANAAGEALYCPYPLAVSIPAMMVGHLTIWGAAEVVFTCGILAFLHAVAPDFGLDKTAAAEGGKVSEGARGAVIALLVALIVATPLGLLATGDAWGEWGVEDLAEMVGYTPAGMDGAWEWSSLMPDYSIGEMPEWVGYILCAVIGVALLIVIFRLAAAAMRPSVDFDSASA
jgi:cobalt/nickel transport system permease protein